MSGPLGREALARHFALTQRTALEGGGRYRVRVLLQAPGAGRLAVRICERHLLYSGACQHRVLTWHGSASRGFWVEGRLSDQAFANLRTGWRRSSGGLAVSATRAGQQARLYAVEMVDPRGRQVLRNTDFSERWQHGLPAAQGHFLPWHMDNVYLEVLVERGVLGLLAMALLLVGALRSL